MRDYIVTLASYGQTNSGKSWVGRWVTHWRAKQAVHALLLSEDYILEDIGVNRQDLLQLIALPWHVDLAWEAQRLQLLRHRHRKC